MGIFDQKYKSILQENDCYSSFQADWGSESEIDLDFFTMKDIENSINKLKQTIGWDGIHSFHIKYSSYKFKRFIHSFFNKCLSHNFIPKNMLKGEIQPVLKGSLAGKYSCSNYRPVMSSFAF